VRHVSRSLRSRIITTFTVLSLSVAASVSLGAYLLASWYLPAQRETAALTRAALDARAVNAALVTGATAGAALEQVPSVGTSQTLLREGDLWFTGTLAVAPDALPQTLLEVGAQSGAQQRVEISGVPHFVVAIPVSGGLFVEVFSLRDIDRVLMAGAWGLAFMTALAGGIGAGAGRLAARRVLSPVQSLSDGALRIADGELGTRLQHTGDSDLDPIAESFNVMASAVQERIAREQRFAANVSHELRSPMTSVMGLTELLEADATSFEPQVRARVEMLANEVQRLRRMLVDLLDTAVLSGDAPAEHVDTDLRLLVQRLFADRGIEGNRVHGDHIRVLTDPRRLERIVGNLLDNAQLHGEGLTGVSIIGSDGDAAIVIEDEGPGIPSGLEHRMFEPFVRGAAAPPGTGAGLGLAIANEQARAIGANLRLEPKSPNGVRAIVHLRSQEAR
jgi:two-component system, OmpR family, sensor histidine kinase MtrB